MCECTCTGPFTPAEVRDALSRARGYLNRSGSVNWNLVLVDAVITTAIGDVTVVQREPDQLHSEDGSASLVVRTDRSGQLFKVDGYHDSYDGVSLDGEFREVRETTKTVKVYE